MKTGFVSLIVGAIGLAMPVQAHHSFSASYLMNDEMSIEGDIVAFQFRNPHVLIIVAVPGDNNEVTRWSVEWTAATAAAGQGVTRDSLLPGDHVIVSGNPGRTAADHRLRMNYIRRVDDGWEWNGDLN